MDHLYLVLYPIDFFETLYIYKWT